MTDKNENVKNVEAENKDAFSESVDVKDVNIAEDKDFEKNYEKAKSASTHDADKLLQNLSRESKADKFNLLNIALPMILIIVTAFSFAFVSRGDIEEMFTVSFNKDTLIDGTYLLQLADIYDKTLPFSDMIKKVGGYLGFSERAESEAPDSSQVEDDPVGEVTTTLPEVTTEVTTTAEVTTTPPETTTAPTTETTEETVPETFLLYANATVNIRLSPGTDGAILGYFIANDEVQVIEIQADGWAKIYYNGMTAYCYSEYLGETTVETTQRKTNSRTEASTDPEESSDVTLAPEDESGEGSETEVVTSGEEIVPEVE